MWADGYIFVTPGSLGTSPSDGEIFAVTLTVTLSRRVADRNTHRPQVGPDGEIGERDPKMELAFMGKLGQTGSRNIIMSLLRGSPILDGIADIIWEVEILMSRTCLIGIVSTEWGSALAHFGGAWPLNVWQACVALGEEIRAAAEAAAEAEAVQAPTEEVAEEAATADEVAAEAEAPTREAAAMREDSAKARVHQAAAARAAAGRRELYEKARAADAKAAYDFRIQGEGRSGFGRRREAAKARAAAREAEEATREAARAEEGAAMEASIAAVESRIADFEADPPSADGAAGE